MQNFYALILIFSPTTDSATQERYRENLSFEACVKAQEAVWMEISQPVGFDRAGRAIFSVDARCDSMSELTTDYIISYFPQ